MSKEYYTGGFRINHVTSFYSKGFQWVNTIGGMTNQLGSYILFYEPFFNDLLDRFYYEINEYNLTVKIHYLSLLEHCKIISYVVALLDELDNTSLSDSNFHSNYDYQVTFQGEIIILTIHFTENQFFIETVIGADNEKFKVLKISKEVARFLASKLITESSKYNVNRIKERN